MRHKNRCGALAERGCSQRASVAGLRSDRILICNLIAPSTHHEQSIRNILNFNKKSPNFDRFNRLDSVINRSSLKIHCSSIIIKAVVMSSPEGLQNARADTERISQWIMTVAEKSAAFRCG
jgi:hypothetical protein